jgi:hypothetical protein
MADERTHQDVLASSFIASAVCATLVCLGIIIGMLLRRGSKRPLELAEPKQSWLSKEGLSGLVSLAGTQNPMKLDTHDGFQPRSMMRTLVIPAGQTVRLMQASDDHPWQCEVRVIQPPGSFAQFSLENGTGPNTIGSVTVPAGGFHDVPVPAGRALFATGTVADVMVSIAGRQVRG